MRRRSLALAIWRGGASRVVLALLARIAGCLRGRRVRRSPAASRVARGRRARQTAPRPSARSTSRLSGRCRKASAPKPRAGRADRCAHRQSAAARCRVRLWFDPYRAFSTGGSSPGAATSRLFCRPDICLSWRAKSTKPAMDACSPVCSAKTSPVWTGRRPSTACETSDQIGAVMRLYCACVAMACPPVDSLRYQQRAGTDSPPGAHLPRPHRFVRRNFITRTLLEGVDARRCRRSATRAASPYQRAPTSRSAGRPRRRPSQSCIRRLSLPYKEKSKTRLTQRSARVSPDRRKKFKKVQNRC